MNLKLLISNKCPACIKTMEILISFSNQNDGIEFKTESIEDLKQNKICIVPALFINDELFCYGEISSDQLSQIKKYNKDVPPSFKT